MFPGKPKQPQWVPVCRLSVIKDRQVNKTKLVAFAPAQGSILFIPAWASREPNQIKIMD